MKKFERICVNGPFGDETSGYIIYAPEDTTVAEFVQMVMEQYPNEWGQITCGLRRIADYRRGILTLGSDYEKFKAARIAAISGHGGWSLMDYNIVIYPMEKKFHPKPTLTPTNGFKF